MGGILSLSIHPLMDGRESFSAFEIAMVKSSYEHVFILFG